MPIDPGRWFWNQAGTIFLDAALLGNVWRVAALHIAGLLCNSSSFCRGKEDAVERRRFELVFCGMEQLVKKLNSALTPPFAKAEALVFVIADAFDASKAE